MPPKSPKGGLVKCWFYYRNISSNKSPFGGFRGQTKKAEKKIEFFETPIIIILEKGDFPGIKNGRRKVFFPAPVVTVR